MIPAESALKYAGIARRITYCSAGHDTNDVLYGVIQLAVLYCGVNYREKIKITVSQTALIFNHMPVKWLEYLKKCDLSSDTAYFGRKFIVFYHCS